MRSVLMKWLGAVPREELIAERAMRNDADKKNLELRTLVTSLEAQLKRERPFIPVSAGDVEPADREKRKAYIAQVAGFHKDILGPKLRLMIADVRAELAKVNRDTFGYSQQEFDLYLKGSENFAWLLQDWGDAAINEMISYQQGVDEVELEELKEQLK